MQVFRLVVPGRVDKVIAFDSLPERIVKGIRTAAPSGLPRHWREFAPHFFVLEYIDLNRDIEKWQEITQYVRKAVSLSVRLMDKIEDMAVKMAPDSHAPLELEPEDVPVIIIPVELLAPTDSDMPPEQYSASGIIHCDVAGCNFETSTKPKLRGHKMGAHKREKVGA